jgi:hypothetical protein
VLRIVALVAFVCVFLVVLVAVGITAIQQPTLLMAICCICGGFFFKLAAAWFSLFSWFLATVFVHSFPI